jgi:hypothetical protein
MDAYQEAGYKIVDARSDAQPVFETCIFEDLFAPLEINNASATVSTR